MVLKTAISLTAPESAYPLGTDDKGYGKTTICAWSSRRSRPMFPNITGAVAASHTELNSVTNRVRQSGDTYTGTHQQHDRATVTAATQTTGDNSTKVANDRGFVAATVPSATLPGQSGKCRQVPDHQRQHGIVGNGVGRRYIRLCRPNNAIDNGLWRLGTGITNGPVGMSVDNGQLIRSCKQYRHFRSLPTPPMTEWHGARLPASAARRLGKRGRWSRLVA